MKKTRPCNRCKKDFEPTEIRRMLCYQCYRHGEARHYIQGSVTDDVSFLMEGR